MNSSPKTASGMAASPQQIEEAMREAIAFYNDAFRPFATKAVIDLRIPEILQKGRGELSVSEIAEQLPSKTVNLEWLFRVMRFCVLSKVFTYDEPANAHLPVGERRFGSTVLSSLLIQDDPTSPAHLLNMCMSFNGFTPVFQVPKAITSGINAFQLANGKDMWTFSQENPEWGTLFNKALASDSLANVPPVITGYKGFKGLKTLVDVGGGTGSTLSLITKAYPEIQAVNFDLPHVVAEAAEIPGVKHVGGDMFKAIPQGDAIIMKGILHDWNDDECVHILNNCHNSLPKDGKVILVEIVLSDVKDAAQHPHLMLGHFSDFLMLFQTTTGKERTAPEWNHLLKTAGFPRVEYTRFATRVSVIEGYKV